MNPDPQNAPSAPQGETPATPPATDAFASPSPAAPTPQAPPATPAPAEFNPLAQSSTPLQPATGPAEQTPPAAPVSSPLAQTPPQATMAPGVPFGDPAQPASSVPTPDTSPVTTPGATAETAKVALILGSIGLLAWLLPIVGLPIAITALVFAIKGMKRGQKYAKLALGFAIFSLVATLINAAVGGYLAYNATQKAASESSQTSSETPALNTEPYPEASRTAFIESCAANGGTESTCTCTLNEIEQQLTFEEFSAVDKEIAETGNVPDSYREIQDNAIAACTE